jgi:hypothetical protein
MEFAMSMFSVPRRDNIEAHRQWHEQKGQPHGW